MTDRQTELIQLIQTDTASNDDIAELYSSVTGFIRRIAMQYSSLLRCPDEVDDLLQEGFFPVINAAKSYDPEAGAEFTSYLAWFLRRAFEAYIGSQQGIGIDAVRLRHGIERYKAEYKASCGQYPSDELICDHFKITLARLQYLHNTGSGPLRLDPPKASKEETTLADTVVDSVNLEEDVIERMTHEEVRQVLRGYINELPAAQRIAVVAFYVLGKTDKQGAALVHMGVNKFRKYRIDGLKNLRRRKHLEELGRYLPERVGSVAYKSADRHKWQSSTEKAAFMSIHEEYWIQAHHIKHEVDDAIKSKNL